MDNKVCCLEGATGASIWNCTTSGMVNSSPAVANDIVYIGSWTPMFMLSELNI